MIFRILIVSFITFFSFSFANDKPTQYAYFKDDDDKKSEVIWTEEIHQDKNEIRIHAETTLTSSKKVEEVTDIVTDLEYNFISFKSFVDKNNTYIITRKGQTLKAEGISKGKKKTKTYDIGDKKWIQDFVFGFKNFIKEKDDKIEFWILDPSNFARYTMQAKKNGSTNTMTINTHQYQKALKVTISYSIFWKAFAWYDIETDIMLKYEAPKEKTTTLFNPTYLNSK